MNDISSQDMSISFFTNCYEGDWEQVLKTGRLERMINNCDVSFFERVLIINNVKNREEVEKFARSAVNKEIINAYYFSEDFRDDIFKAFSIKRNDFILDFHDGYWYSMGPLAAIFHCKTKYLLYFTCDCMIADGFTSLWLIEAINLFRSDNKIIVANPIWEYNKGEASIYSYNEDENWFYGFGFSDQCFLIETNRFYGDIYNYYHISSEAFPIYGGNPFERMINSYMRKMNLTRITNKTVYYTHENLTGEKNGSNGLKTSLKKSVKKIASRLNRKIRTRIRRFLIKVFNL